MSYYSGQIEDHFFNPRNVGELEEADAVGDVCSLTCGAIVRLSLRIEPSSQMINEAKFKAIGCRALIASASRLTEVVKGMIIGEAARLTESEIAEMIGGAPPEKRPCVALCQEALHAAAVHYRKVTLEEWTGEEALICTCFGVSEKSIERMIRTRSLQTIEQVTKACNAGGGCRSCHPLIEDLLEDYWRTVGARMV